MRILNRQHKGCLHHILESININLRLHLDSPLFSNRPEVKSQLLDALYLLTNPGLPACPVTDPDRRNGYFDVQLQGATDEDLKERLKSTSIPIYCQEDELARYIHGRLKLADTLYKCKAYRHALSLLWTVRLLAERTEAEGKVGGPRAPEYHRIMHMTLEAARLRILCFSELEMYTQATKEIDLTIQRLKWHTAVDIRLPAEECRDCWEFFVDDRFEEAFDLALEKIFTRERGKEKTLEGLLQNCAAHLMFLKKQEIGSRSYC